LISSFIRSLKIPKLLSQSIGHYLQIKQIKDEKNNFSIIEKINQLKNLILCMQNKIKIIENVERSRRLKKIQNNNLENGSESSSLNNENSPVKSDKKSFKIVLRKLDKIAKNFEIIEG
jgi:hypothetical protein